MLRITVEQQVASVLLVLEGRLGGAWVEELQKVLSSLGAEASGNGVEIALSSVSGVDAAGRELLVRLHAQGVSLVGTGLGANALIEEVTHSREQERRAGRDVT
jgi:anti-anti-sigma regulatory factor